MRADWLVDQGENTGPGRPAQPDAKVRQMFNIASFMPLPLTLQSFNPDGSQIDVYRTTPSTEMVAALVYDFTLAPAMARNGEYTTQYLSIIPSHRLAYLQVFSRELRSTRMR